MTQEDILLAFLRDHDASLRRIARVYAGADGEEDDLYQEILTQAWKSLPRFRGDASAGTWLYRVALNTALTWRRRARTRATGHALDASEASTRPGSVNGEARSEGAILAEFMATLGGPDRSVLLLYMEGLAYDDIANVTGLSVSTVGVRLHRMKRAFTERYMER